MCVFSSYLQDSDICKTHLFAPSHCTSTFKIILKLFFITEEKGVFIYLNNN